MAHILADRVKETTTTTGTGTLTLAGAVAGFQAFSAVLANNDTTLYAIALGAEWEVGLGTWTTGDNLARTTVLESSNADAAVNFSAGTKEVWITYTPKGEIPRLKLAAGQAAAGGAPLTITAGVVLATPEDGALEMDATNLYFTTDPANRGYIPVRHFIRASAAQTLTDSTAAQNIFDSPAGGTITLETGVYLFEGLIQITGMSGTSGNGQILFAGTGTFGDWMWRVSGLDNSAPTTIADDDAAYFVTNASAASVVAAGTGTALRLDIQGTFECSVAGTLIPQIDLVTGGVTPSVGAGSYLIFERMCASGSVNSLGQWS